jgi:phosphatidylglycerophosphate synthase
MLIKLKTKSPFEYMFRWTSAILVKGIVSKLPVTPNAVTLARFPLILSVFWFYLQGNLQGVIFATIGMTLWDLFDCIDGDLAVYTNRSSKMGEFLETLVDFLFGRLAGPLGFVLTLSHYLVVGDWRVWILLFLMVWMDRSFTLLLDAKNRVLKYPSSEMSQDIGKARYSLVKLSSDYLLYWEFFMSALFVAAAYPFLGIHAYLFPIALYAILYFVYSAGLIVVLFRKVASQPKE